MLIKNLSEKLAITKITFLPDTVMLKINPDNKLIYNLFNFYKNDNIIIKQVDKSQIHIFSKRELLADAAVAISEIYNEYITNHSYKEEAI